MSVEYVVKKGRLYNVGNELLRYKIVIPYIEGAEGINEFYQELAAKCEAFCRDVLLGSLISGNESEKHSYLLECAISHCDLELLTVLLWIRLKKGAHTVNEYALANNWSLAEQMLIPPEMLFKRYGQKGEKTSKHGKSSAFLCDGKLCLLDGFDLLPLFNRKRRA